MLIIVTLATMVKIISTYFINAFTNDAFRTIYTLKHSAYHFVLHRFSREIKVLRRIKHKHIVQYHGTTEISETVIGIILENVQGGSLEDRIADKSKDFTWKFRLMVSFQTATALSYLHSYKPNKSLVHGDVKPQNIMITEKGNVKLVDFGSVNFAAAESASQDSLDKISLCNDATDFYQAPERLSGDKRNPNPAWDVYR